MASAERKPWLRGLGLAAAALLAVAGLSVAYPHGPLAAALLPAWGLLIIWLVLGAVTALRGRPRPAAESVPA